MLILTLSLSLINSTLKTKKTIFLNWILEQFLRQITEENLFWVQKEKKGMNVMRYRPEENTFLALMLR